MPFELVPQAAADRTARLRVSLGGFAKGRSARCLSVVLHPELLARLGWSFEDRIGLRVGHGRDLGKVQLFQHPAGARLGCMPRGALGLLRLRPGEMLGALEAPSAPAEHDVVRGELHVILPWADLEEALREAGAWAA